MANLEKVMLSISIDQWFEYHAPHGDQAVRYEKLRAKGKELAEMIQELCPESEDRLVAIRKVREAIMTANAAIACSDPADVGVGPTGTFGVVVKPENDVTDIENTPYVAVGADELGKAGSLGDVFDCPKCKCVHKITSSKSENGSSSLETYDCSGKTYMIGIDGKKIK